ncbi:alpha/beta hydrolase family protein [Arthrobacter sp. GMC3]|uniref:alpha/beta hydrolase n=1 Tax=Arthrobacter sp. GMC3 TaxID=2058894 RepID=UPI000CE53730|nr:alpha/beta fold hydrolase [Arthrobacter sp. GMC3]
MNFVYGLSLLSGPLPIISVILGGVALAFLVVRRSVKWWLFALVCAGLAAAVSFAGGWAVIHLWYWWPEDLPNTVLLYVGIIVWAVFLGCATAVGGLMRHRRSGAGTLRTSVVRATAAVAAMAIVATVGALQINAYFGQYPTVGSLVQGPPVLAQGVPHAAPAETSQRFMKSSVASRWSVSSAPDAQGEVRSVDIAGKLSGFHARNAVVYLPPAYFSPDRPLLPVLVLVSGQPGSPESWLSATNLKYDLDLFAAKHDGLAPVVVIPDPNGSDQANTMCMNSELGQADTYMAKDVPNWINSHLDVDSNPAHWAVGGFSYGGTCALQMVTRHPDIFQSFVAISPEQEPALAASRQVTIDKAFNGNTAAFDEVLPLTLLAKNKYPDVQGLFASGRSDSMYSENITVLERAAHKAGIESSRESFPGGHSWAVANAALPSALRFLEGRLGF